MIILIFLVMCAVYSAADDPDSSVLKIPSFLSICSRNDPDLNECVKGSVEKLRVHLVKGIKEFGIPACEPLFVPEIVINQGKGPVNIQSTYSNINITGASQFIVKYLKVDIARDRVRLKLYLPFLHMISDYELDGKILMLPIAGRGVAEGNFTDIEAHVLMDGEKFDKGGRTFLHVHSFAVHLHIGHVSVNLDGLFKGDQELGNAMNSFLNDNWETIVDEVKPVLEDKIADMFKTFSNNIYHKYPLDTLLPP